LRLGGRGIEPAQREIVHALREVLAQLARARTRIVAFLASRFRRDRRRLLGRVLRSGPFAVAEEREILPPTALLAAVPDAVADLILPRPLPLA
jgi:hypothetical protein